MRRRAEEGFALLLVFVLAATIGIYLYMQLPRVAFESQRQREELLVERGEQYMRAIQLYYRRFGTYPAKIEDLESTNNIRFLRHRYKDPMTGKDEWRFIHVGQGGVLVDSVVNKNKQTQDKSGQPSANKFITEMTGVGGDDSNAQAGPVSIAMRRRASDAPGAAGQLQAPGGSSPADSNATGDANAQPPATQTAGNAGQPGSANNSSGYGQSAQVGQPSQVGMQSPQSAAAQSSASQASQAAQATAGQPFVFQPGVASQGSNAAIQMIQSILTSPRPMASSIGGPSGGVGGSSSVPTGGNSSGAIFNSGSSNTPSSSDGSGIGGGTGAGTSGGTFSSGNSSAAGDSSSLGGQTMGLPIAGVASTFKAEGIMVYNGRSKYNEWEFIYDPKNDKSQGLMSQVSGGGGTPMSQGASQTNQTNSGSSNSNSFMLGSGSSGSGSGSGFTFGGGSGGGSPSGTSQPQDASAVEPRQTGQPTQ